MRAKVTQIGNSTGLILPKEAAAYGFGIIRNHPFLV